jgi:ribonuclease P protein component
MLPKKYRLKHKKDIEKIIKEGRYFYGPIFWFKIIKNSETFCRLALIVPKKSYKKAVTRNRLKRVFTSLIEQKIRKMPNFDIVVYFKYQKTLPTRAELEQEANKIIAAIH